MRTVAPAAWASRAISVASRVLPMPGSPERIATWRWPPTARSHCRRNRSSSPSRPTNDVRSLVGKTEPMAAGTSVAPSAWAVAADGAPAPSGSVVVAISGWVKAKTTSARLRPRNCWAPTSTRVAPVGRASATRSAVARDSRIWPPSAKARSRAARQVSGHIGTEPLDQLSGRPRSFGRVVGEAAAKRSFDRRPEAGVHAVPHRLALDRGRSGDQRHRGRGETIDVRGRGRLPAGADLGRDIADAARQQAPPSARGRQAEVDQDYLPMRRDDDIGRLDIAVDDGRIVALPVVQGGGELAQVPDGNRGGQTGSAPLAEHPAQVDAFDPVHDEDVPIAHEEAVSNQGQTRVRSEVQQDPRLGQQRLAVVAGPQGADLECHRSAELVVPCPGHVALAAAAHHL